MNRLASQILPLLVLLLPLQLLAGLPAHRNYTEADGLASAHIYCVLQDREGFIWVSTEAGVSRFDGYEFTNFSLADGIADTEVFSIHEDSQGRIWQLGANGRVSYYLNGQFFNTSNDSTLRGLDWDSFHLSFLEDSNGNIWFGNQAYGTACYTANNTVRSFKREADWTWRSSHGIFEDEEGKVWVHVPAGRLLLTADGPKLMSESDLLPELTLRSALRSDGALYGLSRQKVWMQETAAGKWEEQTFLLRENEYPIHMTIDEDDQLWMCTSKGLKLYTSEEVMQQRGGKALIENASVSWTIRDREGNVWASTLDKGLFVFPALNMESYGMVDGLRWLSPSEPVPKACRAPFFKW